ncbi:GATA zinc finger domain-containing protein 14-like isoform X2 [Stegodyphus dumicola]|uniref:GATA zinc finger domain-containing protein 14-like isoform X2 n=1 Tax=Stegodyphus dumicola TaxID=202533 RepID=UPI0015A90158|nr:GATA zinc finger domain-containing protein 14-like isoform X2 [Stegodyphus dumicola]
MRLFIGFLLVLSLAFLISCRYASWDKKFFLQRPFEAENEVLLIVTMSRGREQEVLNCEIVTNEKIMKDVLNLSRNHTIKRPGSEDMQDLLEDCAKFNVRTKRSADEGTYSENDRRNTTNDSRTGNNGRNNSGESRTTTNRQNISSQTRPGNENNTDEYRSVINRQNNSNESSTRNSRRNNTSESNTTVNRNYISNESPNGTSGKNNRNKSHSMTNTPNNFNEPFNDNRGRNQTNEPRTGANKQNNSKDYLPTKDERRNHNETRSRNSRINNTSDKENESDADRSNDSKNNATLNKSAEDSGIDVATSAKDTEDPYNTITTTEGYNGWPVIFPGTKWCGAGDLAKDYDDLGMNEDSDRCCRAHDLCNDTLAPGATKNNLTNTSPFTKFFKLSCKEYERDTSAPMVYQWVSAKRYKKIPLPGPLSISLPFK